ncbi:MAG: hypothetical protein KF869_01080 [Phycisphaeraceae bacterium]|nr:hypothetical protein [Phycisphaeraceae bacterium]
MQATATLIQHPNILTQSVRRGKGLSLASFQPRPFAPSIQAALGTAECDRLVALAAFLPESERAIMLEILRDGRSMVQVARLCDVPHSTLRRRVRSLLARMNSPAFAFVVARRLAAAAARPARTTGRHDRDDPLDHAARAWPAEWSRPRRVAAQMCVLHGLSARRAAQASGERIRVLLRQVQALHELAAEWQATTRSANRPSRPENPR